MEYAFLVLQPCKAQKRGICVVVRFLSIIFDKVGEPIQREENKTELSSVVWNVWQSFILVSTLLFIRCNF